MLNASKGPAVRGPRAQMDRSLYKAAMQRLLGAQSGLHIHDGAVTDLLLQRGGSPGQQATAAGVQLASGKARLPSMHPPTALPAAVYACPDFSSHHTLDRWVGVHLHVHVHAIFLSR